MYVADVPPPGKALPAIWRVTAQGAILSFISGAPLQSPAGLAFGPGGPFGTNLYILDAGNGKIFSVAPDGTITTFARGLPYIGTNTGDLAFAPDGQSLYAGVGDTIVRISATTLERPALGVLANDLGGAGLGNSLLTALLATTTGHGALVLNADGSFRYSATSDYRGTDSFSYEAIQNSLGSNVATVTIGTANANQAPLINAGPDQIISQPTAPVTLHGAISDDALPAGSTLTATWQQISGPTAVTFANPNQATLVDDSRSARHPTDSQRL